MPSNFFQGLKAAGLPVPAGLKWGVLGEGTAKSLKEQGYVADFAVNGDPQSVMEGLPDNAVAYGDTLGNFRWTAENWRMHRPIDFEQTKFEQNF